MKKSADRATKAKAGTCLCPFCNSEADVGVALSCRTCHIVLRRCPKCARVVAQDATKCPGCGARLS